MVAVDESESVSELLVNLQILKMTSNSIGKSLILLHGREPW